MDGIPVLGIEVLGPERRTPVEVVRQLRASQPSSQPAEPASQGTLQREPPQSLLRRTAETGRSSGSKSRSLSPSRRLPAPGEVPWQKFWNTKDAQNQGQSQSRSRIRQASARASRSPSTRPSSPLMVDSRSASMNERRRPAELQSQEKAPQTRDFSPYSPLFRVSWDPSTGRRQFAPSERLHNDARSALSKVLLAAAARGDAVQVSGVLEHAAEMELFEGDVSHVSVSELMEAREQKGCTPLHCAAKHGHAEVCALLLKRRADVRAVEDHGAAPLALAALHGHRNAVRSLLQHRAHPLASDQKGRNAFHLACCNDIETVRILLQTCPGIELLKDAQERNALYYAMGNPTEKSRWEILRLLLDRGCSASEVDAFGRPALYYAVQAGALDVAAMLLQAVDLEQLRPSWFDSGYKASREEAGATANEAAKPTSTDTPASKATSLPDQSNSQAGIAPSEKGRAAPPEADSETYAVAAQALWKAADQSKVQAETTPTQERKPAPPEADAEAYAAAAKALWKAADQSRAQAGTVPAQDKIAPPKADADVFATAAQALWKAADQSRAQVGTVPAEERKPAPPEADADAYATAAKALWKAADQSKVQAPAKPGEESKTERVAEVDSTMKPEPTPSDTVAERSAAETAKAPTGSKADSSAVPSALPTSVPVASTNETPRSYVDPLPAVESACRLGKDPAAAVASDLKALVQKHTFLNPATAKCRHPLHCWVSRCAQVLLSDPVEAQACLARITRGLDLDRHRIDTAFRRFDVDRSDHLDDGELARLAAYLGFDVDPAELDHDENGSISLDEFQDFVGRMGGVQRLFEQRRQQVASLRRDATSLAGVAVGARVRSHFYAGTKPHRTKSEEPEEAIVTGVHFKGEEDIACPSQLEVQLEFLRSGRKTCVPAHWVVSTEEDAEVAAALREVGIHEEDQGFWDSIYPASEMREVCRLTSCQRRALAQVRAHATASHEDAEKRVLARFEEMGFSDKELQAVLSWIQDLAPVIIHVNIDTVGRFLESDEYYRSQFETKTSYGAIDEGNQTRIAWERDLFGDAYDDAKPFERCKYGALNVTNDFEGCKPAFQYGDSYLVLKDVRLRCTFAPEDSGGISGSRLAVLDKYAHVLEEYEEEEIRKLVDVATAPPARPSSEAPRLLRGSTEDPTQQWVTFGFPQLKRKKGCVFFEVELVEGCWLPQVGLASEEFQCSPGVQSRFGVGDDECSCGVDGMHGACLKGGPFCAWNDVSWKKKEPEAYWEEDGQQLLAETVVVGVVVDFDLNAVCFASNGAWSEPWKPQLSQEDMPSFFEGLYPAISVKGRASFQFGPDFKHPPPKSYKWESWPGAGRGRILIDCPAVGDSSVLSIYKEAQIHGEVSLKRNVLRLVAAQKYKQKARCWTVQVSNAGRCSGTYKWSGRQNKRSFYRSPTGAIIYYCMEDTSWHMNDTADTAGFVFRAPVEAVHLSSAGNTGLLSVEPPRGGWKAALEFKGCVRRDVFKPAMLALAVPEDEAHALMQVLCAQAGSDKDLIFRKHGASSFRAEWCKLALRLAAHAEPLARRVPNAAEAWNEVVRSAQAQLLESIGLPRSTCVAVIRSEQCQDTEKRELISLGPGATKEESNGIAVHVLRLQSTDIDILLTEPRLPWRSAGPGARALAMVSSSCFLSSFGLEVPGTVVERGPGALRRLELEESEVARNEIFWPLQEASAEEVQDPPSLRGRWCSRCLGSRCLFEVHATSDDGAVTAEVWLSRSGLQSLRSFTGSYDAASRTLKGSANSSQDSTAWSDTGLEEISLTLSENGLTLSGSADSEEVTFHRRTSCKSYVWCAGSESLEAKDSPVSRQVVQYGKQEKAGDELILGLSKASPLAPLFVEAFLKPSGLAQEQGVRPGWYLDLDATLFGPASESETMKAIKAELGGDFPDNLEDAYRQIHTLYKHLCDWLARPGLSLVFCSAVKAELLPACLVRFAGSPRQQLGEMMEDGTLTGDGLLRSSPAHVAGVRGGWQLDVQKSAELASLNIEKAKETSEAIAEILDGDSERVLAFSCPEGDDAYELQESSDWMEPYVMPGADTVAIRISTSPGNSDEHLLVVAVPTGDELVKPSAEQLQKLASSWEGACDGFYGLKGEEVTVERDSWDEVRLRALCAHHGWDFSWMSEDDERRRRIVEGFAGT
ncbi:ANK2 [Symbiodinium sp. CCMP2456]|nr:ANK2 [Symbiodinium sp. CCMP2456]